VVVLVGLLHGHHALIAASAILTPIFDKRIVAEASPIAASNRARGKALGGG
jgi:hypothetical protein